MNDVVGIFQHLIVPEPDHLESIRFHASCSLLIVDDACGMLSAVHFNDQLSLMRSEVSEVRTNRHLSTKSNSSNLPSSQARPKPLFGFGRITSQASCPLLAD